MSPRKKPSTTLRLFVFLMIALVLFSTIAIVAVYLNGSAGVVPVVPTTWSLVQPLDQPAIIIPWSETGSLIETGADNTETWSSAIDTDISLSLSGA